MKTIHLCFLVLLSSSLFSQTIVFQEDFGVSSSQTNLLSYGYNTDLINQGYSNNSDNIITSLSNPNYGAWVTQHGMTTATDDRFLFCNGNQMNQIIMESNSISINPNTLYEFSFNVANVVDSSYVPSIGGIATPTNLKVDIVSLASNTVIATINTKDIYRTSGSSVQYINFSTKFSSASFNAVKFIIYNNMTGNGHYGNDFIIDEISIKTSVSSGSGENNASIEINDLNTTNDIIVYPNPFTDLFTVKSGIPIKSIYISNTIGQTIFQKEYKGRDNEVSIDLSNIGLSNGTYYITVESDSDIQTISLIRNQ